MKKLYVLFICTFLSVVSINNVNASINEEITACDDNCTIILTGNTSENVIVTSGKNVILDLGSNTLSNDGSSDTIYVEKGATLTIIGNGNVTNNKSGYSPVFNSGTVNIKGGNYSIKVAETGYYVITNHGTMTIDNAKVSNDIADGATSGPSLVENGYYNYANNTNSRLGYVEAENEASPKLIINGGKFNGGLNTIKNDDGAVLEINDGEFNNSAQVSVMNWNEATVNGGVFNTPTGNDKTNIFVSNCGTQDKGVLVINGGTFNAEHTLEGYKLTTPVTVTGGTFNSTVSFINDNKADTKFVDEGTVVTGGEFIQKPSEEDIPEEKEILEEEGKFIIQYKSADYTEVNKAIEAYKAIDKSLYTNDSVIKLEEAVNAVVNGKNITEQELVNAYATNINNAINGLAKIKNPNTIDNIYICFILGIVSLISLGYTFLKLRNNN